MYFNLLPDKAQEKIKEWSQTNQVAYRHMCGNMKPENLDAKLLRSILLRLRIVRHSFFFNVGDLIISGKAIENNIMTPFIASDYDVANYSNRHKSYFIFQEGFNKAFI